MTGSPIFSVNLTNQKNPANLNYHMSIKKSQAILKRSIDLKFSVWTRLVYAGLRKRNHVLWHLELFSAFSSSFLFPPSSFLLPLSSFLFPTASHLVFWKSWPAVDLKKFVTVAKHGFVFWALSVNQTLNLRPLNRFRIVWLFFINIW